MTTGQINKPWASAIPLVDNREIYKSLIDLNQDDQWLDFLDGAGKNTLFSPQDSQSTQPVYHTFYDEPVYELIDTTGATVTGSGTTTVTVTGLTSANQSKLVPGVLLRFPNGFVGRVQTVANASSFTCTAVDGNNLTLTAGMKISAFSNAQEEGSDGPDPMKWGMSSLSNRIQIFRNSVEITDVQNMSAIELEIAGQNMLLPYLMIKGMQRHRGDQALAFWMGRVSTTLFSDASPTLTGAGGKGVQTTRGMDQYVTTYGKTDQVANTGVITLADINDAEALLVAARAPKEFMIVGSQSVVNPYSDFLKGLPSSGAMSSAQMSVNGRTVDLEVETFSHGGFKFHLRQLNVLSNESVINYIGTGAAKIDIARSAYFLPLGKVPTLKGGGMVDYFRYRYMKPQAGPNGANSKTNGRTLEVMTGGLAPIPTSDKLVLKTTWTTNAGLEITAPQKFLKQVVHF